MELSLKRNLSKLAELKSGITIKLAHSNVSQLKANNVYNQLLGL